MFLTANKNQFMLNESCSDPDGFLHMAEVHCLRHVHCEPATNDSVSWFFLFLSWLNCCETVFWSRTVNRQALNHSRVGGFNHISDRTPTTTDCHAGIHVSEHCRANGIHDSTSRPTEHCDLLILPNFRSHSVIPQRRLRHHQIEILFTWKVAQFELCNKQINTNHAAC